VRFRESLPDYFEVRSCRADEIVKMTELQFAIGDPMEPENQSAATLRERLIRAIRFPLKSCTWTLAEVGVRREYPLSLKESTTSESAFIVTGWSLPGRYAFITVFFAVPWRIVRRDESFVLGGNWFRTYDQERTALLCVFFDEGVVQLGESIPSKSRSILANKLSR
jgi:hypothetical protein